LLIILGKFSGPYTNQLCEMVNILKALESVVVQQQARNIWILEQIFGDLFQTLVAEI